MAAYGTRAPFADCPVTVRKADASRTVQIPLRGSNHPANQTAIVRVQQPVNMARKSYVQYRRDALSALTGQTHPQLKGFPSFSPFRGAKHGSPFVDGATESVAAAWAPSEGMAEGNITIAFTSEEYRVLDSQKCVRLTLDCRRCAPSASLDSLCVFVHSNRAAFCLCDLRAAMLRWHATMCMHACSR
jgi:hypothetical protein